jgi:hypothetical protein
MTSETSRQSRNFCLQNKTSLASLATLGSVRPTRYFSPGFGSLLAADTVLTEQVAGGIIVPGSGRLVACLGVDDLVIVDMPDTLMVTTRARSQEVKRLVKKAKDAGWRKLL